MDFDQTNSILGKKSCWYDGGISFSFYGLETSENIIRAMVTFDLWV